MGSISPRIQQAHILSHGAKQENHSDITEKIAVPTIPGLTRLRPSEWDQSVLGFSKHTSCHMAQNKKITVISQKKSQYQQFRGLTRLRPSEWDQSVLGFSKHTSCHMAQNKKITVISQ